RSAAPRARTISVTLGANVTMRCGVCLEGGAGAAHAARSSSTKQKPRRCGRGSLEATEIKLRLAGFFIFHVVVDAEAGAGGGVHLLGGVDRVLQLGDPVLHLCQLFLDLVLQVADFLLRNLKRRLVKLALLIGDNWHSFLRI